MSLNKKIILLILGLPLLFVSSAYASNLPPPPPLKQQGTPKKVVDNPLPVVTIEKVTVDKTSYNAGEEVRGTFLMTNRSDKVLDGLYYSITLAGEYDRGNIPRYRINTQKFSTPIIFNPGEGKEIHYTYKSPLSASGKGLGIQVNSFMSNGAPLGWGDSPRIDFTSEIPGLSINNVYLVTNDGKGYGLEVGPTVKKNGSSTQIYFNVSLKNPHDTKVEVTPVITVVDQFNQDKILKVIKGELISIESKTSSDIQQIELPLFDYAPGVYTGTVKFLDANEIDRAQVLPLKYIVGGDIATIHSFTSKQTSAEPGESIDIALSFTGEPFDIALAGIDENYTPQEKNIDINIDIFNERDIKIGTYIGTTTVREGLKTLNTKIVVEKKAKAMRGVATLSKDGKVLYKKEARFSSQYSELNEEAKKISEFNIDLFAYLSLGVLLLLLIIFRKYVMNNKLLMLLMLVAVGIIVWFLITKPLKMSQEVSAQSYTYYDSFDNGGDYFYINNVYNGMVMSPGSAGYIQASAGYYACYNNASALYGYANGSYVYYGGTGANSCSHERNCHNQCSGSGKNRRCSTVCGNWYWSCNFGTYNGYYNGGGSWGGYFYAPTTPGTYSTNAQGVYSNGAWSYNVVGSAWYTVPISGVCGSANGTVSDSFPSAGAACSAGTYSSTVNNPNTLNWSCAGNAGGSTASCLTYKTAACGSSNGQTLSVTPPNPCSVGTASITTNQNSYTWTCNNGPSSASCSATRQSTCGTADGVLTGVTPSSNLCAAGNASVVTSNTSTHKYEWSCTNGAGNVSTCSAPAKSTCGTRNAPSTVGSGSGITPSTPNICAAENTLFGSITANYGNGLWSWACQNVAQPAQVSCGSSCTAGTYYCENSNTCNTVCSDWCPDSVAGNPTGDQNVKKSFVNIAGNGACSITQIDKYYLRPAIADKTNSCYAFWNLKALNAGTTVTCSVDNVGVSCNNLSTGYPVTSGDHIFKSVVSIDQDGDGVYDYDLSEQKKVKCVPNPDHVEI